MAQFLANPLIGFLPTFFSAVIFLIVIFLYFRLYFRKKTWKGSLTPDWELSSQLIVILIVFHILYAAFLSAGQYYIWSGDEFSKLFLPPHQSIKYFLFYSWTHFWFNATLSFSVALLFYLFLKLLKKYKERFFEKGEIELGTLCILIAGWPNFAVFLPAVFVSVIFISIFNRAVYKEFYTTLGLPFLLATAVSLIFGGWLVDIIGWGVLRM